jgi:ABC-type sulfate/molybdate transport systems ATPase subunit
VAQIPWIENATIRSNIIFGLPDDPARYRSVLEACALEKDLEALTDGDMTEVGANGINLSGGQRWRVTFARALYSRAGILILDDIFSAVDAHVGRHIFKEGLTGDLAQGRTRILVTHHVAMCLPRTKYAVLLGDGTVEHAGLVTDLRGSEVLMEILTQERSLTVDECENRNESSSKGRDAPTWSSRTTNKCPTHVHAAANENNTTGVSEGGSEVGVATTPKRFVEEEKRESGRIKWEIYREYLKSSGGFWFWAMALAVFVGYEIILVGRVGPLLQLLIPFSANVF